MCKYSCEKKIFNQWLAYLKRRFASAVPLPPSASRHQPLQLGTGLTPGTPSQLTPPIAAPPSAAPASLPPSMTPAAATSAAPASLPLALTPVAGLDAGSGAAAPGSGAAVLGSIGTAPTIARRSGSAAPGAVPGSGAYSGGFVSALRLATQEASFSGGGSGSGEALLHPSCFVTGACGDGGWFTHLCNVYAAAPSPGAFSTYNRSCSAIYASATAP